MNPRTATANAQRTLTDATITTINLNSAINNLNDHLAGYPETTPGAAPAEAQPPTPCTHNTCTHIRPCPKHDDHTQLTTVERLATQPDKARTDLEQLNEHLRLAAHHTAQTAILTTKWATNHRLDQATYDAHIWCTNCIGYGEHNPRETDRTECRFCSAFRREHKIPAPREIWNAKNARNGKIDQATVARILRNVKAEQKAKKAAEKAARREQQLQAS